MTNNFDDIRIKIDDAVDRMKNALHGIVDEVENIANPPVYEKARAILAGQSNAHNRYIFANDIFQAIYGFSYVDGASSGKALLHANSGAGAGWYNGTTQYVPDDRVSGEAWDKFFNALSTNTVSDVIWDQGESDFITDYGFAGAYKTGLRAVFQRIRELLPNGKIYVTIPSGTSNGNGGVQAWDQSTPDESAQMVRDTYYDLIKELDYVVGGAERFDLDIANDGTTDHITSEGYQELSKRDAHILNGGGIGPIVSGVAWSGNEITVTISHHGGTDFAPSTDIQGFYFLNGETEISIASAVKIDATRIKITLQQPVPSGGVLYYIYGDNGANVTDKSKLVRDNSTMKMPLRSMRWAL